MKPPRAPAPADLFGAACVQIVDDAEGGIRCWPSFAAPDEADAWFEALVSGVPWTTHRRQMYDRMVDVPRLLASWRIDALPPELPLADMLERVRTHVPAPYNAVGLNLYRDGRDSVAMHNDKLHTIVPGYPITLVSLGDPRRMLVRARGGARERHAIDLVHGSLLSMSHASQLTHEHGIPKTARAVGPRMSVVFRVRPQTQAG
ncbi:alpha-ketoglutarate-dependent dioxygenase AlkB [Luteimonas sp. MC1750]|uniref:alpha-ketoglutarate-dependent dioxygenase AlkB n=1 Tax=Luteimonas sp. MC1750 TaxID=2799326 RepID=UPI0018F06860|nr:alpha-ketoglutarate-dependent dioxygenase AlkB [Luteimonas sp. MC1750]MBJ6983873.1 alpha-ketoglutarate-dependent dioxygenase AlkB [Luteimonas sp. MC1750]QQO06693.1 alpha-ketoglutarate-dependent dioxygenase AlkB [Luteimonas sp. MC1750]